MLLFAFVAFFLLVVAWLMAPNGAVREAAVTAAPAPKLGEPATV